jgi:hypothetical protein
VVVRADPGLVGEIDRGALGLGGRADGRELLVGPPRHGLGVVLVGAVQRPLRGQAHGAQQPAHAHHAQRDLELAADHLPGHLPRPQRELERQLPRICTDDQLVQPGDLRPGQLRRPTRHRLGHQRVPATLTELSQPPVHRLAVQPPRASYILRMRAGLDLLNRPQPQHL